MLQAPRKFAWSRIIFCTVTLNERKNWNSIIVFYIAAYNYTIILHVSSPVSMRLSTTVKKKPTIMYLLNSNVNNIVYKYWSIVLNSNSLILHHVKWKNVSLNIVVFYVFFFNNIPIPCPSVLPLPIWIS